MTPKSVYLPKQRALPKDLSGAQGAQAQATHFQRVQGIQRAKSTKGLWCRV